MSTDPPDPAADQRAVDAWGASQVKADEGRRLLGEAASEARQVITALHRSGMTQVRIAALLGITQGRVSQLIDRTPPKE